MKATKYIISILIMVTIIWIGFHLYKLSNNNIDFSDFKQIPIALGFLISLILFSISINRKLIAFLFFTTSSVILGLGLFYITSNELLFKMESITLLFFGAFALNTISKAKNNLFTIVYFGTAVLLSLSLILEISTPVLQFAQIIFGVMTTLLALISSFKSAN